MDANLLVQQVVETWTINNRINLYLLEAVEPDGMVGVPVGMKGRSVAEIFAHIHNARLMWLDASAPELMNGLTKFANKTADDKAAMTKDALSSALNASAEAVAALLTRGLESGRIKGFKPHPMGFLGYLISHEGYHRGEICLTLTQAGHKLPDKVLYGLWEWGVR